jgi:TPR/MLP1/MLP2-like protein
LSRTETRASEAESQRDRTSQLLQTAHELLRDAQESVTETQRQADSETKRQRAQLEKTRLDMEAARSELQQVREQLFTEKRLADERLTEVREKQSASQRSADEARRETEEARRQLTHVKAQLDAQPRSDGGGGSTTAVIVELEATCASLREEVDHARERITHYQEIAATSEQSLDVLRQADEKRLGEAQAEVEEATVKLAAAEKARINSEQRVAELEGSLAEHGIQMKEAHEQLSALQAGQQEVADTSKAGKEREQSLRSDVATALQRLKEARSQYQREMVLHAEDVQRLAQVTRERDNARQELAEARVKVADGSRLHEEKEHTQAEVCREENWCVCVCVCVCVWVWVWVGVGVKN